MVFFGGGRACLHVTVWFIAGQAIALEVHRNT